MPGPGLQTVSSASNPSALASPPGTMPSREDPDISLRMAVEKKREMGVCNERPWRSAVMQLIRKSTHKTNDSKIGFAFTKKKKMQSWER